ncbi:MAG: hypothetical protein ACREIW_15660 [Chthoniobacterales bacterium]
MKNLKISSLTFSLLMAVFCLPLYAGDSAKEKTFVDSYKKAFESKDTAALQSFLYTQGSDPGILEFYKMMQSAEAGGKVSKIELVDLTLDEGKKAAEPQQSPNGAKVCLTLKPTKKLKFTIEKKDENGGSSSETSNFVAEKDGKFVIPVPGKCK